MGNTLVTKRFESTVLPFLSTKLVLKEKYNSNPSCVRIPNYATLFPGEAKFSPVFGREQNFKD